MTLQVARIAATTAATPYGTLQVATVNVAATSPGVIPVKLQLASVAVTASTNTKPPIVTVGAPVTADAGQTITLAGTDQDTYGTITQRSWRVITGTATLTGATSQTASFKAPASITDQTITLGYTATSSTGMATEATVTHTILAVTERAVKGGTEQPVYIG